MFKVYYQNYNEMFEEIQNLVSYKNNEYYYSLTKIEEMVFNKRKIKKIMVTSKVTYSEGVKLWNLK